MRHVLVIPLLWALSSPAGPPPVELGAVPWIRDLDQGLSQASDSGRPALILFQEVPGCGTCQNFGTAVLGHPLIAEAMETLFVPVAIYNNRGGSDQEALKRFGEPAWNNPVVRIVDGSGRPVSERHAGDYSRAGMVRVMIEALERTGNRVPAYLRLLQAEWASRSATAEPAVFAMACFWSGESRLGAMDGVLETIPGFLHGEEVVEVRYDPTVLPYARLVQAARDRHCTRKVFTRTREQQRIASRVVRENAVPSRDPVRPDDQPKYFLAATSYRYVPMTELQATRVNGAIGYRENPLVHLSPRQREVLHKVEKFPRAGWPIVVGQEDLPAAWEQVHRIVAGLPTSAEDHGRSPIR